MRISVSTIFQIVALFVQDVLELESKQKVATPTETPVATDNQTPIQ
ncbi:hypothetical protein [Nostoc sp.]